MIAIHTKYIGSTDTRPGRVKAYTSPDHNGKKRTAEITATGWLNQDDHFFAVKELIIKHQLDWDISEMCYGDSADGRGYTFCFPSSKVIS